MVLGQIQLLEIVTFQISMSGRMLIVWLLFPPQWQRTLLRMVGPIQFSDLQI
jgi:creatinine amidohydrolase/Fe(II)-dependent formamide hydrolase-like protein